MMFVEMQLNSLNLLSHMAEMRVWLDSKSIDTVRFSYEEDIDRAIAGVVFKRVEAEAFAARFSGRIVHLAPSAAQIAPPGPRLPLRSPV
jgi:hypothetical protein